MSLDRQDDQGPVYRRGQALPRRQGPRGRLRQAVLVIGATAALLCPFLAYVWAHVQIVSTGYQIATAEERLKRLEQDNRRLRFERARLESLPAVEARARELGLEPVPPSRVVRIADRARPAAAPAPPPLPGAPTSAARTAAPGQAPSPVTTARAGDRP